MALLELDEVQYAQAKAHSLAAMHAMGSASEALPETTQDPLKKGGLEGESGTRLPHLAPGSERIDPNSPTMREGGVAASGGRPRRRPSAVLPSKASIDPSKLSPLDQRLMNPELAYGTAADPRTVGPAIDLDVNSATGVHSDEPLDNDTMLISEMYVCVNEMSEELIRALFQGIAGPDMGVECSMM